MKEADQLIVSGAKRGFDGFHVESMALPDTHPDMPVMKIVPYKISREDLPDYDRQQPQKPTRRPIEALADPYSRPFLFLPEFEETAMPIFEGTVVRGKPRTTQPLPAEEVWLSKTRSVFPDNNVEIEEEYGWGMVPSRGRIMPPLVDDPYLPPDDLVDEGTGKKKYVVRSIWDPELFTQEGRMVPPIKDLARALYKACGTSSSSGTRFRSRYGRTRQIEFVWTWRKRSASGQVTIPMRRCSLQTVTRKSSNTRRMPSS